MDLSESRRDSGVESEKMKRADDVPRPRGLLEDALSAYGACQLHSAVSLLRASCLMLVVSSMGEGAT